MSTQLLTFTNNTGYPLQFSYSNGGPNGLTNPTGCVSDISNGKGTAIQVLPSTPECGTISLNPVAVGSSLQMNVASEGIDISCQYVTIPCTTLGLTAGSQSGLCAAPPGGFITIMATVTTISPTETDIIVSFPQA